MPDCYFYESLSANEASGKSSKEVGKVDTHKFWIEAPKGLSMFQTTKEQFESEQKRASINVRYREHIDQLNFKDMAVLGKQIKEPEPAFRTCQICN